MSLICSCQSLVNPQVIEVPTVHPSRPSSIPESQIKWRVEDFQGEAFFVMDYKNFTMLRKVLLEAIEYNKKSNILLCYYRDNLDEEICKDIDEEL